jgi:hypothetical protein
LKLNSKNHDEIVKSSHSGENRCRGFILLLEKTGFRPSPVEDSDSSENDDKECVMTFYGTVSLDFFILKSWCLCAFVAKSLHLHPLSFRIIKRCGNNVGMQSLITHIVLKNLKPGSYARQIGFHKGHSNGLPL